MILRLALRSLAVRPLRTAVLAAGFGLGIAVMAALLGVGEVIIEQAHAPALQGGGDLVVAGGFGAIDNARFILTSALGSPELRSRSRAASPSLKARLYLVKPGMAVPVVVRGGIPSLERAVGDPEITKVAAWIDEPADASWSSPRPGDVLRAIDRFHPMPPPPATSPIAPSADSFRNSWAEWLYFNGRSADGRLRFYLTFLAGATVADGRRASVVRLQLDRDGRSTNYSATALVDAAALLAHAPDVEIAGNRVRLEGSQYRVTLALNGEPPQPADASRPGTALTGEILLDTPPGRSLPPAVVHAARGWVSGYVVPVLSGPLSGTLRIGRDEISLDGATGYHDHNWGFWEGVQWRWGQVASRDLAIVFGRIFPPATVADPARVPGVLVVLGTDGRLAFSNDVTIDEHANAGVPSALTIRARGPRVDMRLAFSVEEAVSSRMALTQLLSGASMTFLQLGGTYRVEGRAGDRTIAFTARGSAETFRN